MVQDQTTKDSLLIGVIYISIASSADNGKHVLDLLDHSLRQQYSHLVIMGDFNYPNVDFVHILSLLPDDAPGSQFLD